jgi:hypothetical protein
VVTIGTITLNVGTVLAGRPKGKRPLGVPRRIWEDVIKMDLLEEEFGGMN